METVNKLLEIETTRRFNTLSDVLSKDIVYELVRLKSYKGLNEVKNAFIDAYSDLPQWNQVIVDRYESREKIVIEFENYGYFKGEYNGSFIKKTPLKMPCICIYTVRDNKITHIKEYWDVSMFERQILKGEEF